MCQHHQNSTGKHLSLPSAGLDRGELSGGALGAFNREVMSRVPGEAGGHRPSSGEGGPRAAPRKAVRGSGRDVPVGRGSPVLGGEQGQSWPRRALRRLPLAETRPRPRPCLHCSRRATPAEPPQQRSLPGVPSSTWAEGPASGFPAAGRGAPTPGSGAGVGGTPARLARPPGTHGSIAAPRP